MMNDTLYEQIRDPEQMDGRLLSEERLDGYLVHDIETLVGPNSSLYLEKFRAVLEGKKPFHLISGIFTGIWLSYRKMWKLLPAYLLFTQMVTSLFLMLEITIVKIFSGSADLYQTMLVLVAIGQGLCWILVGFLGYRIYWYHIKLCLDRHGCRDRMPVYDQALEQQLTRAGGCNVWFVIIGVLFNLINNYVSQYVGELLIRLFL